MLFTDQMGRTLHLPNSPQRIVSLVPSQTELLFDLGLANRIAGITKFCVHPQGCRSTYPLIGGTKKLHLDSIRALRPDLIIGNKEENTREDILSLEKEFPVWMSDIHTLEDALQMVSSLADLTKTSLQGQSLISQIRTAFEGLPFRQLGSAAYLVWHQPLMVAAKNTFIDHMLYLAGFTNAFSSLSRYPQISPDQLAQLSPDYLLLSSEPYPFKEKHLVDYKQLLPNAMVALVDGEMFSWYGSRLLKAAEYFKKIF
jgi:ABC-type Fe3+-hydroxamate transport system substrate-binding protein